MLQFISFGSGSSGNCYFLFTPTEGLMIDAGLGIRAIKKGFHDHGIPLTRIQHLLVTHDHADHVKCVGRLAEELHMPVYATAKVHAGIQDNFCVHNKVPGPQKRVLEKGAEVVLGDFRVLPVGVPHDSADNVGYRIRHGATTFVILTDAGMVTSQMGALISEADFLVLEANYDREMLLAGPYPERLKHRIQSGTGHLSNALAAEALVRYATPRLREVWLCHLSEENNHPELARKTVEQGLAEAGIAVGKDFLLHVLQRKAASPVATLELTEG